MTRIISLIVLVAAAIALISFFLAFGSVVIDPFRNAFNPFDFRLFGEAVFDFMMALSIPLILGMLGLIGLTMPIAKE